jgi:hypothetical protein
MKHPAVLLAIATGVFATLPCVAEDSAYRQDNEAASRAAALGARTLAVYERLPGRGRDTVLQDVLGRFAASSSAIATAEPLRVSTENDRIVAKGEDWYLEVRGEGDSIMYRNKRYMLSPENTPRALEDRPSHEELTKAGLAFVNSELTELVPLASDEGLAAWSSAHLVSYGASVGGGQSKQIYASKVVFRRTLDGVPVLGQGSRVLVELAADGTPIGFDIDWSQFQATKRSQPTIGLDALSERWGTWLGRTGADAASRVIRKLECGYYDTGASSRRRSVTLQPACVYSRVSGAEATAGHVEAIPLGEAIEPDDAWTESLVLAAVQ